MLIFLAFVAIVLLFLISSLLALIGSLIWIGSLSAVKIHRNQQTKRAN
ncbi:hypothetical protein [Fructilactobacillus carniphilus]|uniref:Uncharacterized protein n=1 Tax=Fructilactobacillus carniphilus TaxID=2940297 RepID=A0ABY5BV51_9LACO|nr:hypothetical protein [Fructilactobacillus carniphilus]USS90384.1 hypothetical protein M3M37_05955 [Fructilactobacillus carniphilus]